MKETYILNTNTGTLHIKGKCWHTDYKGELPSNYIVFASRDEVIAHSQLHCKECRLCFKNK